ncbi:TldD/PmbA family protein, partial [Candidatus Thorarchaeota archaeon]
MEDLATAAIDAALKAGASFADVRIENSSTIVIEVTDGVTKRALSSRLRGAGIRAFIDGAWAFGQTTNLSSEAMRSTGESVGKLAVATKERVAECFSIDGPAVKEKLCFSMKKPFRTVSIDEKVAFAKMIDDQARDYDKRIHSTRTVYGELLQELFVANSFGTEVRTENAIPRIISAPTAKEGPNRQRMYKSISMRGGYEILETERARSLGETAAELAVSLLSSVAVKGGVYDVVMDPVLNGVMTHEAFGHAAEADNWPAHTTVLEDKLGESLGPENLSISDDPTLAELRGSLEYDWEGTKTKKRELVKNGVLTELLHSLETASRLDMEPNGAARSQSFMHPPAPRMSNTFMEPEDYEYDELIEDTGEGILLCGFNYGYTLTAKGQFVFQASHGYKIENGELGQMVRDVSLAGNILEVLPKIDAIGKDLEFDAG